MAVYPCDWQSHRYPEPQRSIYVTWVAGDLMQTNKLRLCALHFREACLVVAEHLACIDGSSQMSDVCEECQQPKEAAVYAKVYDEKTEPTDWAGDFCASCAERVVDHLRTAHGTPMRTR